LIYFFPNFFHWMLLKAQINVEILEKYIKVDNGWDGG